jgi:hypothetical protein
VEIQEGITEEQRKGNKQGKGKKGGRKGRQ